MVVAGSALAVRRVSPPAVLAVVVAGRLFVIWDVDNELVLMPATNNCARAPRPRAPTIEIR